MSSIVDLMCLCGHIFDEHDCEGICLGENCCCTQFDEDFNYKYSDED